MTSNAVLNQGVWDGERIVGANWIERSITERSSGVGYGSGVNIGGGPSGYHWWMDEIAGFPAYAALGYGWQMALVVPELDLVIVTGVATTDARTPELQQDPRPIIEELIVGAALIGE
jgi:CubicO group peptidase (beta-lactamase class C family)